MDNIENLEELVRELMDANIVKTGEFTLKSGAKSHLYFDFKGLVSDSKLFPKMCDMLQSQFFNNGVSPKNLNLVGVPVGGIPYASVLSYKTGIPMLIVREEAKGYGLQKQVEGTYTPGSTKVIIVEDVITTGGSVQKIIDIVEANGLTVDRIVCILDREAGGVEKFVSAGYIVNSLFRMSNFVIMVDPFNMPKRRTASRLLEIANKKSTNLIVALDIIDPGQFFQKLELIGPHIAAVKLHIDLMQIGKLDDFIEKLLLLKRKHNFLIIEDRKYADIPTISLMQMAKYKVQLWADMVTVHGIVGAELVKAICNTGIGVILIHQMSVAGNIISKNSAYQDMVFNMGDHLSSSGLDICGFVSQERVRNHLTFSPGVNLDVVTDGMGQTYTPTKDADFIIVGRGITEARDIKEAAEHYQTTFWKRVYCRAE